MRLEMEKKRERVRPCSAVGRSGGGCAVERIGDWLLIVLMACLALWWSLRRFRRWLHEPPGIRLRRLVGRGIVDEDEEPVRQLREAGYNVLGGKHRIPFGVSVDGAPAQPTRLYIDYVAEKDNKFYVVKLERAKRPLEWTPSGLRERLLPYALLFPDCEGILVVDPPARRIRTVRFTAEEEDE